MSWPGLKQGDTVTHLDINRIFKCSWSSGMNRGTETNSLVLFSNHLKSIYHDRWIDDVLHYTGMGQSGDQVLDGNQNRTLYDSRTNGVSVHLFEIFTKGQYIYQGEVELAEEPYQEIQPDADGAERLVWVFPVRLRQASAPLPLEKDVFDKEQGRRRKKAKKLDDMELAHRASRGATNPGSRRVYSNQYERDPYVAELVRRRADGVCDLCQHPAPFEKKDGEPFLEVHHIKWLSKGGSDTADNAVALCPNCHRKMHSLDLSKDRKALRARAEEHTQLYCREIRTLATEYLEEALPAPVHKAFETHLDSCELCGVWFRALKETIDGLGRLSNEELSSATEAILMEQFRKSNPRRPKLVTDPEKDGEE